MLIKIGYPNPLHGCDKIFLRFTLDEFLMSLRSTHHDTYWGVTWSTTDLHVP